MTSASNFRPLTLAIATALAAAFSLPAAPAFAQSGYGDVGTTSMRDRRAKRLKELGKAKDEKAEAAAAALYPEATRESPDAKAKGKPATSFEFGSVFTA